VATGEFIRESARSSVNGNGANGHSSRLLTIGEVARRSGFTVKALRFYDRRGLLPPCGRRASGYRLYSESDLHRLEFIRQAKVLGLTLDGISELVAAAREPGIAPVRPRLLRMLSERIAQTGRHIAALTGLRRELERRRRILVSRHRKDAGRGYCTCLHKQHAQVVPDSPEREARWSGSHAGTGTTR
jgi:MerR family transcriptional regulator, copper efflux regulator